MARIIELFVLANAALGILTFLGVRFVWRRSKDATKRGFEIIHDTKEEDEEWQPGGTDSGKALKDSPIGDASSSDSRSLHSSSASR